MERARSARHRVDHSHLNAPCVGDEGHRDGVAYEGDASLSGAGQVREEAGRARLAADRGIEAVGALIAGDGPNAPFERRRGHVAREREEWNEDAVSEFHDGGGQRRADRAEIQDYRFTAMHRTGCAIAALPCSSEMSATLMRFCSNESRPSFSCAALEQSFTSFHRL